MPDMVSLRTFRLATTTGHMIGFTANKPTYVPDEAVSAAMQAGCVPANEADRPFIDDKQRSRIDFTGSLRASVIHMAIDSIVKENNPKHFDGAGMPKIDVLSAKLGFDVQKDERRSSFQVYMNAKKGGGEFVVHKDASKVLAVINAEGNSELMELARQNGISDEQSKTLTSKDLRRLLLAKFAALQV